MTLDEDEIHEFIEALRVEPNGIFARLVRLGEVPLGIPVARTDVAEAIIKCVACE